jgi:ATP-dependent protease ClpP protease subunit
MTTQQQPMPGPPVQPAPPAASFQPSAATPKTAYVSFSSDVTPTTTEGLLRGCADLVQQGFEVVYLLLSTPGGSVMHGVNIYNVLRSFPFTLITHNVGAVNSIGNVIFLAGKERYACPNSTFMFHGVGFDAPAGMRFEEKFLRERLDSINADQSQIASIIEQRAAFPNPAEVKELFLEAQTKDPAYALAKGIIHDIRDVQIPRGTPVFQLVFQR